MRRFTIGWLCVHFLLAGSIAQAETVTFGGAVVTVPEGWAHDEANGVVVLRPRDVAEGSVCTLTLLGGEPFTGSVMDRLAADWKELGATQNIVWDDKGKLDGAGSPMEIANRAGTIAVTGKASIHVWMVIVHGSGRIQRMIFVATPIETFNKYAAAASALVNGTTFVPVTPPAVPVAESGPAGEFGHMRYATPRGWTEKHYSNGVILTLAHPPIGEHLELLLMTPKPAAGTLDQALETAWDDACAQLAGTKNRTVNNTVYTAREARKSFKGWEYIRASGIMTANADHKDYFLDLFVIKINDRFERLTVFSLNRDHNHILYRSHDLETVVLEYIFSMKFDDWKDAVVEPATLKGPGIIGVWQGVSMVGGGLKGSYAIFYSNGQVFFASRFHLRGCDGQNTWVNAEETPRYWGTYSLKDDAGLIKMSYGEIPIQVKGNDLVLTTNKTDHTYVRLPNVDGATFNGEYVLPAWNGVIPTLTFTAEGHFQDEVALYVLDHGSCGALRTTAEPGGGTYSVRDHTITFRYTDGRVYLLAYPGVDYDKANRSPATLVLSYNDDKLTRK